MQKKIFRSCLLLSISLLFINWGYVGHRKINYTTTSFFPREMATFKLWCNELGLHASDADLRKKNDPSEGKKHYIDIDNYDDFVKNHKIIENFDSAVLIYGKDMVAKNGTLPWSIIATYNALVGEMKTKDWNHAVLTASDLGHYVADSYMPLHITANYDGVQTDQKGVHARYESTMIEKYINEIKYDSSEISPVKNIQSYVFSNIYRNYTYKDSVLIADRTAFEQAGKGYSDVYYDKLWNNSHKFTILLFRNASKSLAELIYTAWVEAGKPDFTASEPQLSMHKI